jgi:hypothetical protein
MKIPKRKTVATAVLLVVAAGLAADDGLLLRKNLSRTPDYETEFAGINMAKFYVDAQKSDGTLLTDIGSSRPCGWTSYSCQQWSHSERNDTYRVPTAIHCDEY